MEGCCTVAISLELRCLFPRLLELSPTEVVAIWDAVSAYILGQLQLDKGVLLPGLGTFAMVHEQFHGEDEVYVVRRPVFRLEMDNSLLQELVFPTVVIPGDVQISPLNYKWLSRATSFPPHVLEDCVQETILLYSFQLRNRQRLAFSFKDIGVLSCKDDVLYMRFYYDCVTGLESKASRIALLHTVSRSRFQLTVLSRRAVARAFSTWHSKAAEKQAMGGGAEGCPGKLLQSRVQRSLPVLPNQGPGAGQQDTGKKPSARVLPPRPGSSSRTKEAGRQEPAPPARPAAALPSSEACKRALREVRQLSAEWERGKTRCQEQLQQAKAEWAAWEAWSAGEERQLPQHSMLVPQQRGRCREQQLQQWP
ncbi:hypothetical protein Q9233_016314 [Columba guinea]|nr:hypothetical protein Q9233_016314 [Columba guinea]